MAGLWLPALTRPCLLSLRAAVAAVFLGRAVNRRLAGRPAVLYVHVTLLLMGITLWIQLAGR